MSTRLRLATPADDTLLRQLLHDNPMPGWVEMALTREPSYFASHGWFGQDWAVLAEDGPPDAPSCVGMYSASVQPLHLNGQPVALGYLGGLRVQSQERRRIRHLRAGYASIRALVPPGPLQPQRPWWLTVVEAGNAPARRLLEAGVAGLPRYLPLGEASTYALPTARGRAPKRPEAALWRPATAQELPTLLAWQREQARAWQFSPVLDAQLLHRIGLHHTWVHETDGAYQAFAVLWDQRAFKQVMALRYHARIAWALGGYNRLAARRRAAPTLDGAAGRAAGTLPHTGGHAGGAGGGASAGGSAAGVSALHLPGRLLRRGV